MTFPLRTPLSADRVFSAAATVAAELGLGSPVLVSAGPPRPDGPPGVGAVVSAARRGEVVFRSGSSYLVVSREAASTLVRRANAAKERGVPSVEVLDGPFLVDGCSVVVFAGVSPASPSESSFPALGRLLRRLHDAAPGPSDAGVFAVSELEDRLDRLFRPSARASVLAVCGRPGADVMDAVAPTVVDTLRSAAAWGSAVLFGAAGVVFTAAGPVLCGWRHAVYGPRMWDLVPAFSEFSAAPESMRYGYGVPDGLVDAPEFVALRRLREVTWMVSAARTAGHVGASASLRARGICAALSAELSALTLG